MKYKTDRVCWKVDSLLSLVLLGTNGYFRSINSVATGTYLCAASEGGKTEKHVLCLHPYGVVRLPLCCVLHTKNHLNRKK